MGKHDKGPWRRYVLMKPRTAGLLLCPRSDESSSIRATVSGDNRPCAVGKEGNVSQLANTECDSCTLLFGAISFTCGFPGFFNIRCAVRLGVCDVGPFDGMYIVIPLPPLLRVGDLKVRPTVSSRHNTATTTTSRNLILAFMTIE